MSRASLTSSPHVPSGWHELARHVARQGSAAAVAVSEAAQSAHEPGCDTTSDLLLGIVITGQGRQTLAHKSQAFL
eukprot:scaffold1581_cov342-Prasinococcus_capsulatus_cf.AAC.6